MNKVVSNKSSVNRLVSDQVVSKKGGLSSGGLLTEWCLNRLVSHRWSLIRVVQRSGGLLKGWSLIRWSLNRVVSRQGGF